MVANLQQTVQKLRGTVQKQVEAAAQLGIDQAKVSKLSAGQITGNASTLDSAQPCPVEPGFEIAENTVDLRGEPMGSLGGSNQTSSC